MIQDTLLLIKAEMIRKKLNYSQFAKAIGVHNTMVSQAFISSKEQAYRVLSFRVYYKMLKFLNIPIEEHLKSFFVEKMDMSKTELWFLKNCVKACIDFGEIELIDTMFSVYLKRDHSLVHHEEVFKYIEELWKENKKLDIPFKKIYMQLLDMLMETEVNSSTNIAIVYYRIFMFDIENNKDTVTQSSINGVIYNIDLLPKKMRLNMLYRLCSFYVQIEDWVALKSTAYKMNIFAEQVAKNFKLMDSVYDHDDELDYPLVKYYGQGHLLQSESFIRRQDYKNAYLFLEKYKDLSWFSDSDPRAPELIERFSCYAEANKYFIDLQQGDTSVIPGYYEYLKLHPNEYLQGIGLIVELSNNVNEKITQNILNKALELIILRDDLVNHHLYYDVYTLQKEFLKLSYELSRYLLKNNEIAEAFDLTLKFLETAIAYKDSKMILKAISLLETYKAYAVQSQMESYDKIREGVVHYEEIS